MSWQIEIPIIVRSLINDLSDQPTYSDERVQQLIVVAAQYVTREVNLANTYIIDIANPNISPDPTTMQAKDVDFIGFVALKASCLLDHSSLRTKAAMEGIRASLGSANLSVGGSLRGYETIINQGPCALYQELRSQYEFGNANTVRSILSPFVGNKFDPRSIQMSPYRSRDLYS